MGLHDGRVLIICLDSSSHQIIVNRGNCFNSNSTVSIDSFRLYYYFFKTLGKFSIRFLKTEDQLLSFQLAWCGTRCWPKRLHSPFVQSFDDNKTNKSYLVLMSLFKIVSGQYHIQRPLLSYCKNFQVHIVKKAFCTSRKEHRREGSSKALHGSRLQDCSRYFCRFVSSFIVLLKNSEQV